MIRLAAVSTALFGAALMLSGAANAGTDFTFQPFSGIAVHSGAHVILRHGAAQKVTVTKGDLSKADLHIAGGNTLDISPCKMWCWNLQTLEVVIVSPKIEAIKAHSGGALTADGAFPKQPVLKIEAYSGGAVDTRAIAVDTANVEAHSGGAVRLKVLSELNANAHSGGAITYTGNPPRLHTTSHAGGAISQD